MPLLIEFLPTTSSFKKILGLGRVIMMERYIAKQFIFSRGILYFAFVFTRCVSDKLISLKFRFKLIQNTESE